MTKKFIDIDSLSRYDSKIKEYIDSSGSGGGGGTSNYNALTNKPKINNVELNGNKTSSDLGLQPAGNYALESEIPDISGKLNTSQVKNAYSTTSGDVYDVTYINSTVGDIESLLAEV